MSIRFIALAMVLNSAVSIVAWQSVVPFPPGRKRKTTVAIVKIRFPNIRIRFRSAGKATD